MCTSYCQFLLLHILLHQVELCGLSTYLNLFHLDLLSDHKGSVATSPNEIEDEKEKLYKSLYEQYYAYYYNYYYQLHNNSPMLQESNQLQIQEDSKSLAINAAAYAAKAGVEQFQKDQEELIRIDKYTFPHR